MKTWLAAPIVLFALSCGKKDPPPAAEASASPPGSAAAKPGPTPVELRCAKTLDHIAKLVAAEPNVPEDTKASMREDVLDPVKRAKRIAECTAQKPELTTCLLEATNVDVMIGCAVKHVPLPPDPPTTQPAAKSP